MIPPLENLTTHIAIEYRLKKSKLTSQEIFETFKIRTEAMGNILAKKEAEHSNSTSGFEANIEALPLEVLEHIWSYLDFDTRQKIATRVSSKWFWGIRCSTKLSSELKIRRGLSNKKINATLTNWPKLRILQVDEGYGNTGYEKFRRGIPN